jgi:predicted dehydrogenase
MRKAFKPLKLSRRAFLGGSLATLLCAGCSKPAVEVALPEWFEHELEVLRKERAEQEKKRTAANDRIGLGIIGMGIRGRHHLGCVTYPGVELRAICDVDAQRLGDTDTSNDKRIERIRDFRDVLSRKEVDAVVIATPDHWHALIAVAAMKAGKDVYCEKPLSLTIAEGRALVRVARETSRVFQIGSQQRSDEPQFRLACELVRNGRLGRLKTIRTLIGQNPVGGPFSTQPAPAGLDWDRWLGPAPSADYVLERLRAWRNWYEYGGGKLTDWGAHHNDIAQWALDMDHSGPTAVEATGQVPSSVPNSYNIHPTFHVKYTYPNRVTLHCTSDQNGVRFEGEDGRWIFVARASSPFKASDARLIEEPLPPDAVRLEACTDHFGNFLDCMRSRKRPICDVEVGHRSATVCHIGVIALRTGKSLTWDPATESFTQEEANTWLSREMRPPWKLES